MQTYAPSRIAFPLFFILLSLSAKAELFTSECKFLIDLPPGVHLTKNRDTLGAVCSFSNENLQETPFVNVISAISWNEMKVLKIDGQPLHDIGFFRLRSPDTIKYLGRPSYVDSRNAYEQKVMRIATEMQTKEGQKNTLIMRSNIRVKWIKKVSETIEKEEKQVFICVDAVTSDASNVAVLNWCLPKNDSNQHSLLQLAKSLKLLVK